MEYTNYIIHGFSSGFVLGMVSYFTSWGIVMLASMIKNR